MKGWVAKIKHVYRDDEYFADDSCKSKFVKSIDNAHIFPTKKRVTDLLPNAIPLRVTITTFDEYKIEYNPGDFDDDDISY